MSERVNARYWRAQLRLLDRVRVAKGGLEVADTLAYMSTGIEIGF
jgi:hypothetical protein